MPRVTVSSLENLAVICKSFAPTEFTKAVSFSETTRLIGTKTLEYILLKSNAVEVLSHGLISQSNLVAYSLTRLLFSLPLFVKIDVSREVSLKAEVPLPSCIMSFFPENVSFMVGCLLSIHSSEPPPLNFLSLNP